MSAVNTIIELDYCLGEDEQDKVKKLFDLIFNMNDQDIKIYDAYSYASQSDFASQVYEEVKVSVDTDSRADCCHD